MDEPARRSAISALLVVTSGGIRSCIVPLSFDAIMSLLAQQIGSYAPPFLYPMFFLIGAGAAYKRFRNERPMGQTKGTDEVKQIKGDGGN